MTDDELVKIHDRILKDHEKRIMALENNQRKMMDSQEEIKEEIKTMHTSIEYIKGTTDTIVNILQSGNTYTYLKYGGLILLGSIIMGVITLAVQGGI